MRPGRCRRSGAEPRDPGRAGARGRHRGHGQLDSRHTPQRPVRAVRSARRVGLSVAAAAPPARSPCGAPPRAPPRGRPSRPGQPARRSRRPTHRASPRGPTNIRPAVLQRRGDAVQHPDPVGRPQLQHHAAGRLVVEPQHPGLRGRLPRRLRRRVVALLAGQRLPSASVPSSTRPSSARSSAGSGRPPKRGETVKRRTTTPSSLPWRSPVSSSAACTSSECRASTPAAAESTPGRSGATISTAVGSRPASRTWGRPLASASRRARSCGTGSDGDPAEPLPGQRGPAAPPQLGQQRLLPRAPHPGPGRERVGLGQRLEQVEQQAGAAVDLRAPSVPRASRRPA